MSKIIEQIKAERDKELREVLAEANEHYSQLSEEIQERTEKRILDFYRNHPDEIRDVVTLVKDECHNLVLTSYAEAGREPTTEEREALEDEDRRDNLDNFIVTGEGQDAQFVYDLIFSDVSLRERLYSALDAYLSLLKEISPNLFQQATHFIDDCISHKKDIIVKAQLNGEAPIANITTIRPKEAIFGVSKVENTAFNNRRNRHFYNDKRPVHIEVGKQKGRLVDALISIDFKEMKKLGVTIENEQMLTPYDREIHNAVSTLCAAGNEYINPQMIFQVLSGNTGPRAKMSNEAREKILRSIDKMRYTEIEIDAAEEVRAGWNKKASYKGALIPSERVEIVKLNGQETVDSIHLFRNPPLYDYANNKNQIDRVDIKMLNAPISNTPENIELKGYLMRQISTMKNSHSKLRPVIRYDTLYEYLCVEAPNPDALKHKQKEIRDKTKKFLDFWVQEGFIVGYSEEKEGRTIAKLKIDIG